MPPDPEKGRTSGKDFYLVTWPLESDEEEKPTSSSTERKEKRRKKKRSNEYVDEDEEASETTNWGYPDPEYFDRVKAELSDVGVTLE